MTQPPAKSHELPVHYAALLGIIILGIFIRIYNIGYRSFWLDELYSVSYAIMPIKGLLRVVRTANQTPLYFILLHVWIWIFGDSDGAVRSLSILFGLLGMVGFYLLLRRGLRWSAKSSLIGLALLAVSPFHIYYSIEARTYSLMFALATFYLTAFALMHAEGNAKYYLVFAFLQSLLLYAHPTAAIYCLCINATSVFLLFLLRERSRLRLRNLVAADLITAIMFAPWGATLLRQVHSVHESFWAKLPTPVEALKTWLSIVLFWSPELVRFLSHNNAGRFLVWIAIITPVCLLMARGGISLLRRKKLVELLIVLSLFVYPAAIYIISLLFKPIFMNKIFIPSLIGLLVLLALPEEREDIPGTRRPIPYLVSGFFIISVGLSFAVTMVDINADWRNISAAISRRATPGDLVLVYENYGAPLLKRYSKSKLDFQGATRDFEEELIQRTLQTNKGATFYRPFFSQAAMGRRERLVAGRPRFFMVFSSLRDKEVVDARDYMLGRYAVTERVDLRQAEIFLLSSSPGDHLGVPQ
jgi:mannosyltransferase